MKKFLLAVIYLTLLFGPLYAVDFPANVTIDSWSGLDASGKLEPSLPVTIAVFDAATNVKVSDISVSGPGTSIAMPSFVISVPANTTLKVKYYATVTDAKGNASAKSADSNEVTLFGDDTIPPEKINSINITIPLGD